MAIVVTDSKHYADIAAAIRSKNGEQTKYKPEQMAAAIKNISGGGYIADAAISDSKLDTLIIRAEKITSLQSKNALANTPIASGTGYIYVPKSLVERYKVATNWVVYAAQIRAIEDYPEITGGAK